MRSERGLRRCGCVEMGCKSGMLQKLGRTAGFRERGCRDEVWENWGAQVEAEDGIQVGWQWRIAQVVRKMGCKWKCGKMGCGKLECTGGTYPGPQDQGSEWERQGSGRKSPRGSGPQGKLTPPKGGVHKRENGGVCKSPGLGTGTLGDACSTRRARRADLAILWVPVNRERNLGVQGGGRASSRTCSRGRGSPLRRAGSESRAGAAGGSWRQG